jgi:hypothetical protein
MFRWASNGDLYFADGANVLRISPDGASKTTLLSDPTAIAGGGDRLPQWALCHLRLVGPLRHQ